MNTKHSNQKAAFVSAVLGSCLTLSTAIFADDTEIYFSQNSSNTNIAANVLFMLDNSGSMGSFDGTDTRRMDKMKFAVRDVLNNTNNVNIGIGTFNGSDEGGSISYPVTPIDADICVDASCARVDAYAFMESGDDDAEELTEAPNAVDTTADYISLGTIYDKEQKPGTSGLRFVGLNVPRGATILNATIEFSTELPDRIKNIEAILEEVTNGDANFLIAGEATGNAAPYTNATGSITSRPATIASATWIPGDWDKYPFKAKSTNIAPIVEEIVGRADWCGGNSIAFKISGTGTRIGQAWDLYSPAAPKLRVTYDPGSINFDNTCLTKKIVASVGTGSDDALETITSGSVNVSASTQSLLVDTEQQISGFRFSNVQIPQGATVKDAYLQLQASKNDTGPANIRLIGHASDQSFPFSSAANELSSRTPTGAQIMWNSMSDTTVDQRVKSPPITAIVQEIVSRPGWSEGNAMSVLATTLNASADRGFHSFESSSSASARLHVEYEVASTTTSIPSFYTARDKLKQVISDYQHLHGTPLLDAYLEGAHYFMGKPVFFGKKRGYQWESERPLRVSHENSYTGGTLNRPPGCTVDDLDAPECVNEKIDGSPNYISPIENACQANQLILLSDGSPTRNNIGTVGPALMEGATCADTGDETCGRELASWLAANDVAPHIPGDQFLNTSTVGFNFSGDILSDMASNGGGSFFEAESAGDLTRAFQDIFNGFADVDASFVSPSITVNQANRLTSRDDVYFALFKPSNTPDWVGNLKRYKMGIPAGDTGNQVQILSMDNTPAIDPATGLFKPGARSWWSTADDGPAVADGGAANNLTELRDIYTYLADDPFSNSTFLFDPGKITKQLLGIVGETDQHHFDLLAWATGLDVKDEDEDLATNDARMRMGDPLHSTPTVVDYSTGVSSVIFFGTNEGILHAIDASDGTELSGIIPPQLLPNLNLLYNNRADTPHPYGLDGAITTWIENDNGNSIVDAGETAYLTIGMRRGGNRYYTFDITNPSAPQLAWDIGPERSGFDELGQTWSAPIKTLVSVYGTMKTALIFGGGYDVSNDTKTLRGPDMQGRSIYIVDALNGNPIWTYSFADEGKMQYSIPSDIRVIDLNFDGAADRIYFGDMGGQIWRFDFNNRNDGSNFSATGDVIAELSDDTLAGNRRFFYEPDVALVNEEGSDFLAISIGSGWRAHPLDTEVQDRFFSFRDYAVFGTPKDASGNLSYSTLTEGDLVDATYYSAGSTPLVTDGWYMNLDRAGEKVLAEAITINNQIIFTSYRPETGLSDCSSALGFGSVYVVDVFNAAPTNDLDESGSEVLTTTDKRTDLDRPGIPPKPGAAFPEGAKPTVFVGPEDKLPDLDFGPLTTQTYWAEQLEQ